MSYYFHVSIDIYSVDVQKIPIEDLLKLGDNRILLHNRWSARGKHYRNHPKAQADILVAMQIRNL
jgi:hypothetical protein